MLKFKQLLEQIMVEVSSSAKASSSKCSEVISPYMQKSLEMEYEIIATRYESLDIDNKLQAIKDMNQNTKEHLKEKYLRLQNKIYS